MHLVTYTAGREQAAVGALRGDQVFPVSADGQAPTMKDLIDAGASTWQRASRDAQESTEGVPLESVRLMAPISNPRKVVAIGLNYMDHCREQNVEPPKRPLVFAKFTSSIIGPGEPITWDPDLTSQVDYEVELGVVMGRRARNVQRDTALDYVFGYTVVNDISARDLQFGDEQWVRGKSLDTFCPIGPAIVTADEVPDPQNLSLLCTVNGTTLQDSSTSEMIFGVAELISYLSRSFTLEPGDVIATGTPFGVGVFRDPKIFLGDGDVVVAEVGGIGRLENPVRL